MRAALAPPEPPLPAGPGCSSLGSAAVQGLPTAHAREGRLWGLSSEQPLAFPAKPQQIVRLSQAWSWTRVRCQQALRGCTEFQK